MRRSPNKSNKERQIIFVPDPDEEAAKADLLQLYEYLFFFNSDSTLFYTDAPPRDTPRQLDVTLWFVVLIMQIQTCDIPYTDAGLPTPRGKKCGAFGLR